MRPQRRAAFSRAPVEPESKWSAMGSSQTAAVMSASVSCPWLLLKVPVRESRILRSAAPESVPVNVPESGTIIASGAGGTRVGFGFCLRYAYDTAVSTM
jgi:hypothetical protein